MLCVSCGADKARTYSKKIDGKEVKLCLCERCYKKLYEEDESDFFASFLGNAGGSEGKICPQCGTSLADFRRTGLLGCSFCYTEFWDEILSTVRVVQGRDRHAGKVPPASTGNRYFRMRELLREQEQLKTEVERKMRSGKFAEAEALKERLKQLNKILYGGESNS